GGFTDVCIHYTFVDAHQHDYHCRVVEDCVGGSTIESHVAALKAIEYLQHGAVTDSENVRNAFNHYHSNSFKKTVADEK
ncbi:MAG: nicotinamidase-related amidase, partial [Candidatus Azotimanducaceae bacterium]